VAVHLTWQKWPTNGDKQRLHPKSAAGFFPVNGRGYMPSRPCDCLEKPSLWGCYLAGCGLLRWGRRRGEFPLQCPSTFAPMAAILSRFPLIETASLYDARKKTSSIWGAHRSRLFGKKKYQLTHNRAEMPRSALNYISCSAGVEAESAGPLPRYWVIIPLNGHIEAAVDGQEFCASPSTAVVLAPWEQHCLRATPVECMILELDEPLVSESLGDGLAGARGCVLEGPYRNALQAMLLGVASVLDDWATGALGTKSHPAFLSHLETAVASCMAGGVKDATDGGYQGGVVGSIPLQAIRSFLRCHLAEKITVADIASSFGISVRTLQSGFADHHFMSPMAMLRVMRLDEARKLLKSPKGPQSIADVCSLVGYGHAGRFAQEYRTRFCESPSETLGKRLAPLPCSGPT
jgi:AraC-like DNA-binding protein